MTDYEARYRALKDEIRKAAAREDAIATASLGVTAGQWVIHQAAFAVLVEILAKADELETEDER